MASIVNGSYVGRPLSRSHLEKPSKLWIDDRRRDFARLADICEGTLGENDRLMAELLDARRRIDELEEENERLRERQQNVGISPRPASAATNGLDPSIRSLERMNERLTPSSGAASDLSPPPVDDAATTARLDCVIIADVATANNNVLPLAPVNGVVGAPTLNAQALYVTCHVCGHAFWGKYRAKSLKRHKARVHRVQILLCAWCGKAFSMGSALELHLQNVHAERAAPIAAPTMTGPVIASVASLRPTRPRFACKFCEKTFIRVVLLEHHINEEHGAGGLHVAAANIIDRSVTLNGDSQPSTSSAPPPRKRVRTNDPIRCVRCDIEFVGRGRWNLRRMHMQIVHASAHATNIFDRFAPQAARTTSSVRDALEEYLSPFARTDAAPAAAVEAAAESVAAEASPPAADEQPLPAAASDASPPVAIECGSCDETFASEQMLNLHTMSVHRDEPEATTSAKADEIEVITIDDDD